MKKVITVDIQLLPPIFRTKNKKLKRILERIFRNYIDYYLRPYLFSGSTIEDINVRKGYGIIIITNKLEEEIIPRFSAIEIYSFEKGYIINLYDEYGYRIFIITVYKNRIEMFDGRTLYILPRKLENEVLKQIAQKWKMNFQCSCLVRMLGKNPEKILQKIISWGKNE